MDSSAPLYRQLVDRITLQIDGGEYRPGDKLPSERGLCEAFGVSQITVRRALRELANVGRVYSRHGLGWYVADAPIAGQRPAIALVMAAGDPLLGALLPVCMAALGRAGIQAEALWCGDDETAMQTTLGLLHGVGPQAVLWGVSGPEQELAANYQALVDGSGLPALLLLRQIDGLAVPAIVLDESQAIARTTAYLMDQGHRRMAYIGGDPSLAGGWRRYWGFATAIWERGLDLPLDWILAVPQDEAIPEEWLAQVLGGAQRPTAVVCASDALAAEAMQRVQAMGLACPAQVAVAGLGDDPLAAYVSPPLTTFRLDTEAWAQAVAQAARALLDGRLPESQAYAGELVIRESCGAPPA